MLRHKIVTGLLARYIGGQGTMLIDAYVKARKRAEEGAQLDHASDPVTRAVNRVRIFLLGWLYRHLFRTHQHQHTITIVQILLG